MPRIKREADNADVYEESQRPTRETTRTWLFETFAGQHLDGHVGRWFLDQCLDPWKARDDQATQVGITGGHGKRWHDPYLQRVKQCAEIYLGLSQRDRELLEAGVEDGVHWRGEPIKQFVEIWEETQILRDIGTTAYIKRCKARAAKVNLEPDYLSDPGVRHR